MTVMHRQSVQPSMAQLSQLLTCTQYKLKHNVIATETHNPHTHTHTYTHTCNYMYIYQYTPEHVPTLHAPSWGGNVYCQHAWGQ